MSLYGSGLSFGTSPFYKFAMLAKSSCYDCSVKCVLMMAVRNEDRFSEAERVIISIFGRSTLQEV